LLAGQGEDGDRGLPAAAAAVAGDPGRRELGAPVAIVGMACRFPGGIASPEDLWRLVDEGGDVVSPFPTDRGWDTTDLEAGRGGFLADAAGFDAGLFAIPGREALAMDPQQRLLLEVAWEALERAGIDPLSLDGTDAGVFAGLSAGDYRALLDRAVEDVEAYQLSGAAGSAASGRVAYALGLQGPAVSIDTATSSSLVALHMACASLRLEECSLALVGGVSVLSTPSWFRGFAQQGGLAADGRCKAFGSGADGTVWSEGVGVVVVERLSDAVRNGHRVLAVVRGSAVNQDGASGGLTAPSGRAQQRVIARALAAAGVAAADVDVVEGHGTGTVAGDPVEAAAVLATYGQGRATPVGLGSVKSNIGHTQAAAGLAGLIKMVMALQAEVVPATLHADVPSPHVDWSAGRVEVLSRSRPWSPPPGGRPRRAGVSSLGYAGTNAHVVLEEAPPLVPAAVGGPVGGGRARRLTMPVPLVVSAASPVALSAQAARLAEWWRASPDVPLADVGWSLASGRAALDHRAVVVTSDHYMAMLGLDALAAGEREAGVLVPGKVTGGGVGFAFSGQGAQRPGMGRALHETFPVFAEAFDEACELLSAELGLAASAVRDVTWAPDEDGRASRLDQTVFTQAGLFAVEVAVARLLGSFGIEPDVVLGHSIGELAAAHVAGVFSLADACRLVAARGQLMQALPPGGAMVALQASADEVAELLAGQDQVALAAVNGPDAVVVSGDEAAVVALAERWAASGRRTKRLQVGHAFHSPLVEPMLADFAPVAASIEYREPDLPLISTVTGAEVSGDATDPGYWVEQVRRTVRFGAAVRTAATEGVTTMLEVGPGGQLAGLIAANLDDSPLDMAGVPVMRPGLDEPASVVMALAAAWARCATVDFTPLLAGGDMVDLPTYAFQHERFWPTVDPSRAGPRANGAGGNGSGHRPPETPAPAATGLAARVAGLDASERVRALVEVVRSEAVAVLGDRAHGALDVERTFKDLGFESRDVVELRNGLQEATGLRLPSAVVFDHPTPVALAKELAERSSGPRPAAVAARPAVTPVEADEPIAIVGMACRFPGGVTSPESLWDLVDGEVDAIDDFPEDRAWAALLDGEVRGSFVRKGGFVAEATQFDAGLFGISPREAMAMDPQQRLLLEVVWEAVERAGIDPTDLHGTDTGVFAGLMNGEYAQLLASDPAASGVGGIDGLGLTGGLSSVTSGRVAYVLGLEGPAVTVDTACSSSLVALHLACGSLRLGECSLGLVGGVSVLSTPSWFRGFAAQGGLAADGRCKAFGATADGTGWSEGVGVVVVERLSEAQRLGHDVWGVVRGSAINQDGASNGLTAPSGLAQRRVIGRALAAAGVSAAEVDVVEAHGTGTVLGDPVEAGAVLATYGQDRSTPVGLGSVKSNIGHTQAAAGLAGVMKMVMAMRAGVVPATLHAADPSPHIDWSAGSVELLREPRPWDTPDRRPRRAGVSSFGISGTNAHVILEEAASSADDPPAVVDLRSQRPQLPVPLVVSARSPAALTEYGRRLAERVRDDDSLVLADVGWSLATTRTAMDHRAVVVVPSADGDLARAGLDALAGGSPVAHLTTGQASAAGGREPVLVFPGQGAQWAGMAAGLMDQMPVFRRAVSECAEAIDPLVDWSLVDVVTGRAGFEGVNARPDVVQPALFAVMVGLSRVWASFGVTPAAVVGHSQGEIAAACVAGALSLEDAARVVVLRAQRLSRLSGRGGMVSLALSEEAARELIAPWTSAGSAGSGTSAGSDGARIGVATVNGPSSVTVSGEPGALDELGKACEAAGVRWSRVAVDYASHSPQVEAIRDELLAALADITPKAAAVPFWSTVTGEVVDDTASLDAAYWYRNLREPVRFAPVVAALAEAGHGLFVEASPHPMLVPAVQATLDSLDSAGPGGSGGHALGTLRRDDGGPLRMVSAVGEAWAHGAAVDWSSLFVGARRVDLPTYPFQRRRYWPSVTPATLSSAGPRLLATEWVALDVPSAVPEAVEQWVVPVPRADVDDLADAGRQAVVETLGQVQSAGTGGADRPLAVVTRGAVALDGDDRSVASGVAAAGVWGLVRAAQSETPGAFVLVDVDDDPASLELVPAAVASGEPEVAIRDGRMWGRRLVRSAPMASSSSPSSSAAGSAFDRDGAVLITGGTGTLGGLVARHLISQHGVRRLVLTSRRGPDAAGAQELVRALEELGAEVDVVAADVADAPAMSAAVRERDVRGIVHLAGALDDGVVSGLTPERVATAWAPKAGGAWVLHELGRDLDVSAFVVFSSTAGTLGAAGQANYAAASVFADAVVEHRRALGLPGRSIAWGLWSEASGLTGTMESSGLARMRRAGVVPLATDDALDLLDRALSSSGDEAVVTALHLDLGEVAAGPVLPLWRRLAWRPEGSNRLPAVPLLSDDAAADAADAAVEQGRGSRLTKRLEGLRTSERQRVVVDAVRAEAAVVLGYESVDEVAVTRAFKDMGVDSLTAVELRNRLGTLTGLSLETTVVFDHPTVEQLAREIERQLAAHSSSSPSAGPSSALPSADAVRRRLADLEAMVEELSSASGSADVTLTTDLRAGLRRALDRLGQPTPPSAPSAASQPDGSGGGTVEDQLSGADAAAVLDFIDREFGRVDPT
jgi:acyl transferase domain-containing protein